MKATRVKIGKNFAEIIEGIANAHYSGKLSQLAEKLNVTPTALYRIRDGKTIPSAEMIGRLIELHGDIDANTFFK